MKLDLSVTSSPHIHQGEGVRGIMMDVLIALLPAGIAGIFFFGADAFYIIAVSIISCVTFEWLWQKILKKPNTSFDLSAAVTGLLLAYNMPPAIPLWIVVIGSFFAIIIVKQLFGGLGHNFINPALAGRAFLLAAWASDMTKWVSPSFFGADAISTATPLSMIKNGNLSDLPLLSDMFIGNIGGCIGETSTALLILGGLYLIFKRVITLRIPVSFIATVAVLTMIFGGGSFSSNINLTAYHLLSGGLFLAAIFMATDYTTSPVTPLGQIVMGIGCGVITTLIRLAGGYPEGVTYSILLMNVATPLIDKYTKPRVFGHFKKARGNING